MSFLASDCVACDGLLVTHFSDKRVYQLSAPDCAKYGQVVVFGVRRTRRERNRLRHAELIRARDLIDEMSRKWNELGALPDEPNAVYPIPEIGPLKLVYNGLPLDEIEDLLPNSPAYRQASRILFAPPKKIEGRPLTPLHPGHVALLTVSSMLDGVLGSGEHRHIAAWRCIKVTDRSEEVEEDGTIIQSERERFTNELTLVYASGRRPSCVELKSADRRCRKAMRKGRLAPEELAEVRAKIRALIG